MDKKMSLLLSLNKEKQDFLKGYDIKKHLLELTQFDIPNCTPVLWSPRKSYYGIGEIRYDVKTTAAIVELYKCHTALNEMVYIKERKYFRPDRLLGPAEEGYEQVAINNAWALITKYNSGYKAAFTWNHLDSYESFISISVYYDIALNKQSLDMLISNNTCVEVDENNFWCYSPRSSNPLLLFDVDKEIPYDKNK